jgi:hypothetical protein
VVEELTPQNTTAESADAVEVGSKTAFFSTSGGRIALILGAVVVFLGIAGAAVFMVLSFLGGAVTEVVQDAIEAGQPASSTSTSTITATLVPVEPDDVPYGDLFTFRDIFVPVLKPTPAVVDTDTITSTPGEPDTLYLLNIIVEDGVPRAVLEFNGSEYVLAEGEDVSGTPWQVLSIGSDSVVMLFGDSRVTLAVGQGVTTDSTSPGTSTPTTK